MQTVQYLVMRIDHAGARVVVLMRGWMKAVSGGCLDNVLTEMVGIRRTLGLSEFGGLF